MSLPGSSKGTQGGNGDGEGMMLTIMLIVAAVSMVFATGILSVWLHSYYGKYLWNW